MRNLLKALYAGYSLKNPETWKNKQTVINIFITIAAGISLMLPEKYGLSINDISVTGQFIGIMAFGLYNAYFTVATSDKVGMPTPSQTPPTALPEVNKSGTIENPGDGLV